MILWLMMYFEKTIKSLSMRMAFMNLANSILGAGIITQPFAIKNAGILGGLLSYVALGFIVDWTLRLIVINLTLAGKRTYQGTVEHVMGKKGKLLILFTNGLFAFGGCIGYCIIIGDTNPTYSELYSARTMVMYIFGSGEML